MGCPPHALELDSAPATTAAGMAWLVGSEGDPPSTALPVGDNYALVTLQKGLPQRRVQVP